ncbi:MAG: hypothetical protein PHI84_05810 [Kiritimatiellae bacterium]|nr:hypothetical protein [Kiritimatiellia bacterium]
MKKAAEAWNDLIENIRADGEANVPDLKERCVFILNCMGLSLSQLLGQNWPSPAKEDMSSPGELLGNILKNSDIDRVERKRLNKGLKEILSYYGHARHFGQNKDDQNYHTIDELNVTKLNECRKIAIDIWDTLIQIFQQDKNNDLDAWRSICDLVYFEEYVPTDNSVNAS